MVLDNQGMATGDPRGPGPRGGDHPPALRERRGRVPHRRREGAPEGRQGSALRHRLGSRGYSVLEQGRIDAVLSANPTQRRAIFEEAAGISRYRQRRHETELRLKRCEQDVARLEDVMGELRSRVRSQDPGREGREVRRAKAEWTEGRTRLLSHRFVEYERTLSELKPRIDEVEGGLDGLRERRAECERAIEAREEERREVVSQLESVGDEASRISETCVPWRSARRSSPCGSPPGRRAPPRRVSARPCSRPSLVSVRASSTGSAPRSRRSGSAPPPPRSARVDWRPRPASSGGLKELRGEVQAQNDRVLERLHERTAAGEPRRAPRRGAAAGEGTSGACDPACAERRGSPRERGRGTHGARGHARSGGRRRRGGRRGPHRRRRGARGGGAESFGAPGGARERRRRARGTPQRGRLCSTETASSRISRAARRVLEACASGEGPCREDELWPSLQIISEPTSASRGPSTPFSGSAPRPSWARDAHVARRVVDWCAPARRSARSPS